MRLARVSYLMSVRFKRQLARGAVGGRDSNYHHRRCLCMLLGIGCIGGAYTSTTLVHEREQYRQWPRVGNVKAMRLARKPYLTTVRFKQQFPNPPLNTLLVGYRPGAEQSAVILDGARVESNRRHDRHHCSSVLSHACLCKHCCPRVPQSTP